MKKISVIGTGYVGLVTGTCLADFGLDVICVDSNVEKIQGLEQGQIPIYEPGLDDWVKRNVKDERLHFTTDIKMSIEESDIIFIAVGTPPLDDGSSDLQAVMRVAQDIGTYMNGYKVIVNKSTVPVGTGQKVKYIISYTLRERYKNYDFDIVSNPEFLREGSAVSDFIEPDRIILGIESDKARKVMENVYKTLTLKQVPFIVTNIETAEMIKYASNAFLAMKITYINEIANLCEKVGADVHFVAEAMGKDERISPKFLQPGPGYGGSCFPKDTKALVKIGQKYDCPMTLIEQTVIANEEQKYKMVEKIKQAMGSLKGKKIGVLGITFKPNTDDMREAPSLVILNKLVKEGADLKVFDPQGEKEGEWRLSDIKNRLIFCQDEYDAVKDADALVILTEWNQFKAMDLNQIKSNMKGNYFFDFRNIYERMTVEQHGFKYHCVGR